jgi:hypothetical protein
MGIVIPLQIYNTKVKKRKLLNMHGVNEVRKLR